MHQKPLDEERQIVILTRELIGGKPPSQVPVSLIPKLISSLEKSKLKAIKDGQVTRVQLIQKATESLEKYQKSIQYTHKTKIEKVETGPPPPIVVLDSTIEDLIDGIPYDIAQTSMLPHLSERCKQIISSLLAQGNYSEAQKYENVHKQLVSLMNKRESEKKVQSRQRFLKDQYKTFNRQLEDVKKKYDFAMESFEMEYQSKISKLNEEFEKELRDFDLITDGPIPLANRKFSSKLLNLRETEKFLLKSRRYDEAASIKAEADEQEKKEISDLEEKFLNERLLQREQLKDLQQQKLKCFNEKEERKRRKIIQENEKEINTLQKTVENLENKIDLTDTVDQDSTSTNVHSARPPTSITSKHTPFVTQATVPDRNAKSIGKKRPKSARPLKPFHC